MSTQVRERQADDRAAAGAGRIEGLDGLRALAVTAVLVYHLRPASLPGGFLGVDVFFVVSGFLITTLLLRELRARGRLDLPRFWVRRVRRLVPALVAVVLVTIPLAWLADTDLLVGIGRQTLGALTFSTNWVEVAAGTSYFTATAPQLFVNFWSLAVEEQFYLLWPLLLAAVVAASSSARHRALAALAAAVVSAVLMAVLYVPGEDATRVYYGTDTHLFGLMIGAALAFAWAAPGGGPLAAPAWRRRRGLVAAGALVGLLLLMLTLRQASPLTFRGGILLGSVLSAALVAALLGPPTRFQRLMRLRPLEWLGRRSYSVYLWHWPVILIADAVVPTAYDSAAHWVLRAAAVGVTLGAAALSFRLVEEPVRRLGFRACVRRARALLVSRVPARRALARAVTGAGALAVVASLAAIAVAPERSRTHDRITAGQEAVDASADRAEVVAPAPADYSMPTGEEITGFGDSIVVTSADGLEARFPGVMLDARSIRQWPDGERAVRTRLAEGTVRRAVFLDFGTNAGVRDEALVRRVLDSLGDRLIVVVNLYGGSHWVPDANATLERIVADYPNAVVADWHAAISEQPELLQADGIHPGIEGAHLYADVVARAFAALSERLTGMPVDPDAPAAADEPGADPAGSPAADEPAAGAAEPSAAATPATSSAHRTG
ncbi:acyltransferase family protein [Georgenia thermotolerans]|uniref:Acyltransferase family protein n=1 Tax=Georgenia thermotolerans TaxID=527326 RepID=A0A7J5ULB5_9MICO|nr:acyltransferase family protein [Georgenia thermotolerans]KAE8763152.1 acyltransferase family protein [Georgenia thermotolerans]